MNHPTDKRCHTFPPRVYTSQQYPPATQQSSSPCAGEAPPLASRKKALLVGIDYIDNKEAELNGCVNDAICLQFLLASKFGFTESNMVILTDAATDPQKRPTKANLINAMKWLTGGVQAGDSLFFSFSGHGAQTTECNADEDHGKNETILPVDYKTAGLIKDLHDLLAKPITLGAKLTCIMDCCHSGTGLDLPYVYSENRSRVEKSVATKSTQGDVVLFRGCLDPPSSQDSLRKVAFSGVLTFTFWQAVESDANLTYGGLLSAMQKFSHAKGFWQSIQLSSGKKLDLNTPFLI